MIGLVLSMQLMSATFKPNATVPVKMAARQCGGQNISPELHWSDVPKSAKSLAIILHDPDAPLAGGFDHWIVYDLAPTTTHLEMGETIDAKNSGTNGTGKLGYFGPCPPPSTPHHYNFTLYALDIESVGATTPLTAGELLKRMKGHVIAQTTLTGLYATSSK